MEAQKKLPLIFLVEDNESILSAIKREAGKVMGELKIFKSGEEAMHHLDENPKAVMIDYEMKGSVSGKKTLLNFRRMIPDSRIIMYSRGKDKDLTINNFERKTQEHYTKLEDGVKRMGALLERTVKNAMKEETQNKLMWMLVACGFIALVVIILSVSYLFPEYM